jgi:purine-binding chemotaxis protein CheW
MTSRDESQKRGLAEPEQVVYDYLDLLLKEVDGQPEVEVAVAPAPAPVSAPVVEIRPDVAAPVEEPVEAEPTTPDWADEPFQALIFRVQGVTMAVPLLLLDGIMKWNDDAVPMPWQPEWHMGVLPYQGRQMVVVDSVQLLMPEESENDPATRGRGSHILVIGDGRWGLACDSLAKPVILHKDEVQWGGQNPDRAWAIGTVIERLCVLLDVAAVAEIIRHEKCLEK